VVERSHRTLYADAEGATHASLLDLAWELGIAIDKLLTLESAHCPVCRCRHGEGNDGDYAS
jgi:hypothetical protein